MLDEATYQTIAALSSRGVGQVPEIEYWIDIGSSVVGLDYRPHGVKNVYVTGAALFPTSGSWNPTLTMCGLAQDLADRLS